MTATGRALRLRRLILPDSQSSLICALDHGMTSPQYLPGLGDMKKRVQQAISGGANVFMLGRGMARIVAGEFRPSTALALMLTASAAGQPQGAEITGISSVEEALRFGADAVVVYVALGSENERWMITYLSEVAEACFAFGMPLIAEAEFPDAYRSLTDSNQEYGLSYLVRNARLCADLGADIIKVNWPGSESGMAAIIEAVQEVPIVLAGGTLISDEELLSRMECAVRLGAVGCSVGRNIFEHRNPEAITRALAKVIHERLPASEAIHELPD